MRLLMIAPACDGEDVGESWVASRWAQSMSKAHDLTLLTTFKHGHTPMSRQLPGARVIEWSEPAGVGRAERLNSLLQPGYIPFYVRARRWIGGQLAAGEQFDVAHQVVPVAMRYPSPAAGFSIPLVVGPVGGSLESPRAFVDEEGATPWWQRLRRLDGWRIAHDPLLRRTYESADCVIGVADYVRDFLSPVALRRLEIMSEIAVDAVQDPVNRMHDGPVRLLFVGRIVRTKGLRDVIRALDQVRDLDVELDVVGDGNDRSWCERVARELDVQERVHFHGAVPRATVDAFYERADVFAFPSYREPGGSVVLEAMSFGLPLIICRRGGPEANVDDTCAFQLEAESPAQLASDCAKAIRALVEDEQLRLRMGEAARRYVVSSHLWPQRIARVSRIYEELAGQVQGIDKTARS